MKKKVTQIQDTKGTYHSVYFDQIINSAQEVIHEYFSKGNPLTSPQAVRDQLQILLAPSEREIFSVLYLDSQHRLISYKELFTGTIDSAAVYPREVVKAALAANAAAVILAHNHPSGVSDPSNADIRITNRIKDALSLVDIRILDHFIVGETTTSFAERGLL